MYSTEQSFFSHKELKTHVSDVPQKEDNDEVSRLVNNVTKMCLKTRFLDLGHDVQTDYNLP